jgi:hypothetical protein
VSGYVVECTRKVWPKWVGSPSTSPELMQYFTSKGFWALATLNVNRSRKCPLPKENDLKKTGRGASTINVNKEKFGCEILVRQQKSAQNVKFC